MLILDKRIVLIEILKLFLYICLLKILCIPKPQQNVMNTYGPQLTALLKKMDWSQKTLAHHLRVSPQHINALIHSKKGLSDNKAAHIATVANLTLEELKVLHLSIEQKQHFMDTTNSEMLANALKFMQHFLDTPDLPH